jgi:hypothetical protein
VKRADKLRDIAKVHREWPFPFQTTFERGKFITTAGMGIINLVKL